MHSLDRGATSNQHHSNKTQKECGLIKNPLYPAVLDEVVASLIDQHSLGAPRGACKTSSGLTFFSKIANKNDKTIKLVDDKALNCVVLDKDLAYEKFAFRIPVMVMMISAVLLIYLVNFIWIRCPHVPAAFDVMQHTVGLALYLDQNHLCKLKKEAAMFHLWSYLIEKIYVSQCSSNYSEAFTI